MCHLECKSELAAFPDLEDGVPDHGLGQVRHKLPHDSFDHLPRCARNGGLELLLAQSGCRCAGFDNREWGRGDERFTDRREKGGRLDRLGPVSGFRG